MIQSSSSADRVLESLTAETGVDSAQDTSRTLSGLGLDSLGTIRWSQRLRTQFGIRLPLHMLTGVTTVAQVLELAEGGRVDAVPVTAAPPEPTDMTVVQQAYWSGRAGEFPGGGVATFWYHEYDRAPEQQGGSAPEDDIARVETAWKRVVAHHPLLRTTIDRDARPQVARYDVRDWSMPRHDLRALNEQEAADRTAQLRWELSHQVRPADTWPLVDVQAILLPGGVVRYCVGFDALLVDFASWGSVMRQWGELVRHPHNELPAPRGEFWDAVAARATDPQRRARRDEDRAWWEQQTLPPAPLWEGEFPEGGARFTRRRRVVEPAVWGAVTDRARERGVSPTSLVLTAFALAAHRWGSRPEGGITLNLTVFDRPEGWDDVVGDFSTTALLSLQEEHGFTPQGAADFATLAAAVNRRLWEVLEHRAYGGVEVARDRPGQGPWPVVFTSGLGQSSGTDDAWLGERVFGVSQTPQVVWDHLVWEEDGALVLTHDVADGVIDPVVVEGVLGMEEALLRSLASGSGWDRPAPGWDPCAEVIPPAHVDADTGPLLHDPWLRACEQVPDACAVAWNGGSLTHAELRARAQAVAEVVSARGAGPGDLVLVALPKGVDQVVAVLGVALAGAGYVPADPSWPLTRLTSVRDRTGLSLALVSEEVTLPSGVERLSLGEYAPASGLRSTRGVVPDAADPATRPDPDELAYVIFTSGSTGEPKGVAIEHRQARTTVDEVNARFGFTNSDTVLALSALSFDLSVHDLFGVLGRGGTVVMPDPERLRDPQHWLDMMAEHHITVWNTAPPLMEMLVEYAEALPPAQRAGLAGLRLCMLSGDWIPVTLPDRLRALTPACEVHSLGGATEASIWSITYPVGDVNPNWPSIPYGRALPGQSFWILDEGRPACMGGAGELFIGGEGVARGYIGAPDLTAERFLDRPDLNTRLYRTGDVGRWLPDGNIEFLGRTDRQVKVGGHRIELGEVEAALLRLPMMRQAVASSLRGPDGRPRLVAHISGRGQAWADQDSRTQQDLRDRLREALNNELPPYMIPSSMVLMNELPTTANGKVDYQGLPNPFSGSSRPSDPAAGKATGLPAKLLPAPEETPLPEEGDAWAHPNTPGRNAPAGRRPVSLREGVLDIIGDHADPTLSAAGNSVNSLQLVRLANFIEDQGLPRPSLIEMLADAPLESLIWRWERSAGETAQIGTTARTPSLVDTPGSAADAPLHVTRDHPDEAVTATESANHPAPIRTHGLEHPTREPLPEAEAPVTPNTPGPGRPPGGSPTALPDLARRLRLAADAVDRADSELRAVRSLLANMSIQGSTGDTEPLIDAAPAPMPTPPPATLPNRVQVSPSHPAGRDPVAPPTGTAEEGAEFDLTEMQLAYLVGRAPDEYGRALAPHYYTEALVQDLDVERFVAAFDTVTARHPMLRASITPNTRQAIAVEMASPVEVEDHRHMSPAEQQTRRERIRADRSHRLLPTDEAPGIRVLAARLDEHVWRLHLDIDLLFCDADSAVTLMEELRMLYRNTDTVLPAPPASFQAWTKQRSLAGVDETPARQFWAEQVPLMPDAVVPPVRHDRARGDGSGQFVRRRLVLDPGEWQRVRRRAAETGVTVSCLLLHELGQVLAPERPGTVMLTLSQRPEGHLGVVGDYTATVPVTIGGRDARPAEEQQSLAATLEFSLPEGGLHGNDVIRLLRDAGRPASIPVAVSCSLSPAGLDASQLLDGFGHTEYAISQTPQVLADVQIFDVAGELRCNIDVDESVVDPTWAEEVFFRWGRALDDLADSSNAETVSKGVGHHRARRDVEEVFGELLDQVRWDGRSTWFEQGATSVSLVTAQRMLRERGYELDVVDMFAHPTPIDLVALLQGCSVPVPTRGDVPAPVAGEGAVGAGVSGGWVEARHGSAGHASEERHHGSAALDAAARRGRRRRAVR